MHLGRPSWALPALALGVGPATQKKSLETPARFRAESVRGEPALSGPPTPQVQAAGSGAGDSTPAGRVANAVAGRARGAAEGRFQLT